MITTKDAAQAVQFLLAWAAVGWIADELMELAEHVMNERDALEAARDR
jgi:hypothetical protein